MRKTIFKQIKKERNLIFTFIIEKFEFDERKINFIFFLDHRKISDYSFQIFDLHSSHKKEVNTIGTKTPLNYNAIPFIFTEDETNV